MIIEQLAFFIRTGISQLTRYVSIMGIDMKGADSHANNL